MLNCSYHYSDDVLLLRFLCFLHGDELLTQLLIHGLLLLLALALDLLLFGLGLLQQLRGRLLHQQPGKWSVPYAGMQFRRFILSSSTKYVVHNVGLTTQGTGGRDIRFMRTPIPHEAVP